MADLDKIRIIVEPDTSGFQRELDSDLSKIQADVPVGIDTTPAKVQIKRFEAGLEADPIDIPIDADTKRARLALQRFTEGAGRPITKSVTLLTSGASASLNTLGAQSKRTFATIGRQARTAGGAIAVAVGGLAVLGKDELLEANRVSTQTQQILKQTGLSAQTSTKQIESFSGALLEKTGIDDQAIQSSVNFLLTQKEIQNTIKDQPAFLRQAATAATDLASSPAFNGNMQAASKALGKALGDPEKGLVALRRAGVLFSAEEKKRIALLNESGRTSEAQALVLDKVNESLGGLGGARGKSAEGQLSKINELFRGGGAAILSGLLPALSAVGGALRKAFSDTGVITKLGRALSPIIPAVKAIASIFAGELVKNGPKTSGVFDKIRAAAEGFAKVIEDHRPEIRQFAKIIGENLTNALRLTINLWKVIVAVVKPFIPPIITIAAILLKMAGVLFKVTASIVGFIANSKLFQDTMKNTAKFLMFLVDMFILGAKTIQNSVSLIGSFLSNLPEFFRAAFDKAVEFVKFAIGLYFKIVTFLPRKTIMAMISLGKLLLGFFKRVWTFALNAAKSIINGFVRFVIALPGRVLTALSSLGQRLWGVASRAFNRFWDAAKAKVIEIILWVRGIPGRIKDNLGDLARLLYKKGKDVINGFWDGLKAVWTKIKGWLSGLGSKIKQLKGPIEVDRGLLVDEGKAVMGGFQRGLESKWSSVEGFLSSRGGFIKGLLTGSGVNKFSAIVGDMLAGSIAPTKAINMLDGLTSVGGLHPTSGLADTTAMAGVIAKRFGLLISSIFRSYDTVPGPRVSQHTLGEAADFVGAAAALDRAAFELSRLVDRVFTQIIWRNQLWKGGRPGFGHVPHHGPGDNPHLHAGWLRRERGGRLNRGQLSMVGERGPEPFIPDSSGFVLSSSKFARLLNMDSRVRNIETAIRASRGGMAMVGGKQVNQTNNFNVELRHNVPDAGSLMAVLNTRLDTLARAALPSIAGGAA